MTVNENDTTGRRCTTCHWALQQDRGYSNWTVMDTEWFCLKNLNPHLPTEEGYDANPKDDNQWKRAIKFGATCHEHRFGDPVNVDCDQEGSLYREPDPIKKWAAYADPERAALMRPRLIRALRAKRQRPT